MKSLELPDMNIAKGLVMSDLLDSDGQRIFLPCCSTVACGIHKSTWRLL